MTHQGNAGRLVYEKTAQVGDHDVKLHASVHQPMRPLFVVNRLPLDEDTAPGILPCGIPCVLRQLSDVPAALC